MKEQTLATLAAEIVAAKRPFTRTDTGDQTFYKLADDSPEWMRDIMHAAHGDTMLPDDWRYECAFNACQYLADGGDPDELSEFADSQVDIYNIERLRWLASHASRANIVDEAVEDLGGHSDQGILSDIALGQYAEASDVFAHVVDALIERLDDVTAQE